MLTILVGWIFGLVQGLRHAFEPDHLAAVSTMVSEQRSARASALYATAWGVGHALVLTVVGGALFILRAQMPSRLENLFEVLVGMMLILLGLRAIRQAIVAGRGGVPTEHRHAVISHEHGGDPDHVHLRGWTLARRPLLVGAIHGLAGSGALTALVMAKLPSVLQGLIFMALYGTGAMFGMALLGGVAGAPLARLARTRNGMPALLGLSGVLSLGLGVAWGYAAAVRVGAG